MRTRRRRRVTMSLHVALTLLLGVVLPFVAYLALGHAGLDITPAILGLVVLALLVTAALVWLEGSSSLHRPTLPSWPIPWYPPATAIILSPPDDDTQALARMIQRLRRDYSAPLQVIVAFTVPVSVQVQDALDELARRDPKLLLLYAERGRLKEDALTAALSRVEGEFVGLFNTCLDPGGRAFSRAWMWLSNGYDAVQGRPVITNGSASTVASRDAVESLAPGYPGHAVETFDNTTSFWVTDVLQQVRRQDDATGAFVPFLYLDRWVPVDPEIIAPRTAPTSPADLFGQRAAWAEDIFRTPLKQLRCALRNSSIPRYRKIELFHLQAWRPVYTWFALQIIPLIAYWIWHAGLHPRAWLIPSVGLLALYVVHLVPGQTLFAYLAADQEMRGHKRWFFSYCVRSPLFYAQLENVIQGVGQMRALLAAPRFGSKRTPRGYPASRASAATPPPIPFPRKSGERGARDHWSAPVEPAGSATLESEPASEAVPAMTPVRISQYLAELAETLSGRLEELEAQRAARLKKVRALEERYEATLDRVSALEESRRQALDRKSRLEEAHRRFFEARSASTVDMAQVEAIQHTLQTLVDNPHHVASLGTVSEQVHDLAATVEDYAQLRRILTDL